MRISVSRIACVVLAFVWASSAMAGGHLGGGSPDGAGEMRLMEKMGADLNLTENQKKDFAALLELYRPRFEEIARRGSADRKKLLEAAPDAPDYTVLAEQVSAEAGRAAAETVTLLAELQGLVYALLSADQRERYLQLRAERRAKMQEYRDKKAAGDYEHDMHHKCGHCNHEEGYCPHHDSSAVQSDGS